MLIAILLRAAFLAAGIFVVFLIVKLIFPRVYRSVTFEAGEALSADIFFRYNMPEDAVLSEESAAIGTDTPGEYEIEITAGEDTFYSTLKIVDTTPPEAQAVSADAWLGQVPEASECVENISDATDVAVEWKQEPDVSAEGEASGVVSLTDEGGNVTDIDVTVNVIADTTPPEIDAMDIELTVGDSVSYLSDVTVTDNLDSDPELEVDNSEVNLNKAGEYQVTYTATDAAGNEGSVTITVTVKPGLHEGANEDYVLYLAEEILGEITTDDMSDMQVAYAIYRWTKYNISYTSTSDKTSWVIGAYDAFTKRKGDCFSYFAAAKALLTAADIESIEIDKLRSSSRSSRHYWNLVCIDGYWYHLDSTVFNVTANLCLLTDDELTAWDNRKYKGEHSFDDSELPERSTQSVQEYIDYSEETLSMNYDLTDLFG